MAEPQASLPDASPAPPSGGDSVSDSLGLRDVTSKMADNQRQKVAATDKVYGDLTATLDKSLPKIEQLAKTAGVEAEKLKPWDADAEAAKRRTDPIEAFGSFGSVFGILASAFTHAPMENALNASAAAMNAIKEGDNKAYDRAAKAWENNLKMTMDRHKIQHDAYQDATSLLSTNMQAAQTKLQVLAARFGDKQVQTLLDAGMNKEVEDLLAARQKNAQAMKEGEGRLFEQNMIMGRYLALGGDPKNPQSEKSQKAWEKLREEQVAQKAAERAYTPEQQAYAQFIKEKPDATPEERADYIQQLRARPKELTPEQTAVNTFIEQNPTASADDLKKFVTELRAAGRSGGPSGNTSLTGDRQRAKDVADFRKELQEAKNPDGSPQYTREEIAEKAANYEKHLKTVASAPSGNKVDDIKSRENKVTVAEHTIDQIDDMLLKHKAITGIGGKITRTSEAVGNILGSNATDRAQFRRWVLELQETLPSVINDRSGKPLSSEASKIEGIIAGLAAGDTNANTLRAYDELRPLLKTIKKQLQERRGETPGPAEAPKAGRTPSWQDAPEVK